MTQDLPSEPSPFPTLREGFAIGASENAGFVNAFNWIAEILRKASDFFCLGVNDRSGKINIVAGEGINVTTSGQTITISIGNGDNTDTDTTTDPDDPTTPTTPTGTGGGGTAGGGGGTGTGGRWTDATPSGGKPHGDGVSNCNNWSDEVPDNSDSDDAGNDGDNCNELNGW